MAVVSGQSAEEFRARKAAYMREYRRKKRNGERTGHPPVLERLMSRVTKRDDGCWIFEGVINNSGYGEIGNGTKRRQLVHRVILQELQGLDLRGLVVHHICKTRRCVNPDHLEVLTNAEHSRMEFSRRRMQCPNCGWVEDD